MSRQDQESVDLSLLKVVQWSELESRKVGDEGPEDLAHENGGPITSLLARRVYICSSGRSFHVDIGVR